MTEKQKDNLALALTNYLHREIIENCHEKYNISQEDMMTIYLIPNAVIGRCNFMLRKNGLKEFNMQKVLHNLFACNLIKVHWILTCDIRYRPQKRVGKTKKRYITFIRREVETRMLLEDLGF